MDDFEYDLIVIGAGPGGMAAAIHGGLHGLKVAVINEGRLLGYGINGVFKSKSLFELARHVRHHNLNWPDAFLHHDNLNFEAYQRSVSRQSDALETIHRQELDKLEIDLIAGRGRFLDSHTVAVGDRVLKSKFIVISTGTKPKVFPGMAVDGTSIVTSDHIVDLNRPPDTLLVLGAGVIGCEFASLFACLGSQVTLIDTQPTILSNEDADISQFLTKQFGDLKVRVLSSCRSLNMETRDGKAYTKLSHGETIVADITLIAVGRVPNTEGLDLAKAGVALDSRGYVPTDHQMTTNVPHIYAVGDVGLRTTPLDLSLAHVAEAEGRRAVRAILKSPILGGLEHIPFIIFTLPTIAGAGLNETTARERYGKDIRVGKYPYGRNHRAHAMQSPEGFVKLVVAPAGNDRLLGVRVIGRDADSLIGSASVMIEHELPYTYLMDSIQAHPSLCETLQGAAHIIAGDALGYAEGEEYRP